MHLLAEVRDSLLEAIRFMRDTAADPEKIQGRLTKEDKVRCTLNLISSPRKVSLFDNGWKLCYGIQCIWSVFIKALRNYKLE